MPKKRKAVGIDNLPYEVLKNEKSVKVLTILFNKVFEFGIVPSMWKHTIIKPIPKSSMIDFRMPLQYRAISLISTVSKLYAGVINNRLIIYTEQNNIIVDEQNGFRNKRSCMDHIHTLTTVIRKRKHKGLNTFVAFVDLEKAFDRIDRNLLFYRLLTYNINGKIYNTIKAMYESCKSCININGWITDDFISRYGVKQGDVLSPILFNLYINDLARQIKESELGINLDNLNFSILLYADDMAVISDSEEKLQKMLDIMHEWCNKWRIKINCSKTNVVHFRPASKVRTNSEFHIGSNKIQLVEKYKYLGVVLNEYIDYEITSSTFADVGNRALGGIIHKCKSMNGLRYNTYTTLYDRCITPILDYCSGVWGSKPLFKIDTVQNRAIRYYMGVHKFAPNLAITGDMGWIPSCIRRKINVLKLWNKLLGLDDTRLTKQIFYWDYSNSYLSWCSDVKRIFQEVSMVHCYQNLLRCDITSAKEILLSQFFEKWVHDCTTVSKLRTYVKFKTNFEVEPYLDILSNRKIRSYVSQLRCGILPLRIETGRYGTKYIPECERTCIFCNSGEIESEYHFIFDCVLYETYRKELFTAMSNISPSFLNKDRNGRMKEFMSTIGIRNFSNYIHKSFELRKSILFVST